MDYEQLREDLREVLDELMEKNRVAPVIVEGKHDRHALQALGVRGDIRVLNRGNSVLALCEAIGREYREAVILTDWDVRGGRLARNLRDALTATGVRYDDQLRARLTILCRKDIKDVESLHRFVERVESLAAAGSHQRPSKRYYSEHARTRDVRRRSRG